MRGHDERHQHKMMRVAVVVHHHHHHHSLLEAVGISVFDVIYSIFNDF